MASHANCPNCHSTKAYAGIYRCPNGHIYCDVCSRVGFISNHCPKCKENNTGTKLGEIRSK